jgi:hypothetical protein
MLALIGWIAAAWFTLMGSFVLVMRACFAAMAVILSGCSWTPVALYGHVSDPGAGQPFNADCEDTSDFLGMGAGQVWGKTRVYVAGGTKRFRVCVNDQRPADVRDEFAGKLLVIREFELRR